jgi:hypothetical protein
MSGPALPVRRVLARLDRQRGRWVPCGESDARGSVLMLVDATGRAVQAVYGNPFMGTARVLGWRSCPTTTTHDPAEFLGWMQSHPELEIVK